MNLKIAALVLIIKLTVSHALVCYNCTDCAAAGAQLTKINCEGQCFVKKKSF